MNDQIPSPISMTFDESVWRYVMSLIAQRPLNESEAVMNGFRVQYADGMQKLKPEPNQEQKPATKAKKS